MPAPPIDEDAERALRLFGWEVAEWLQERGVPDEEARMLIRTVLPDVALKAWEALRERRG